MTQLHGPCGAVIGTDENGCRASDFIIEFGRGAGELIDMAGLRGRYFRSGGAESRMLFSMAHYGFRSISQSNEVGIHPSYKELSVVPAGTSSKRARRTNATSEWKSGPTVSVFAGIRRLIDSAGRLDKFERKYEKIRANRSPAPQTTAQQIWSGWCASRLGERRTRLVRDALSILTANAQASCLSAYSVAEILSGSIQAPDMTPWQRFSTDKPISDSDQGSK